MGQQFQQLYREMVNCVTYHVTFTTLSLQASTILVSGESLVNILDNIANNLQDYGSLDLGQIMDEYSGGDVDQHHQQKSQQGSSKNRLKGGVLPAYCDPPNPCPKGYTAEDGCIEMDDFENKAEFSRKYQASQSCMCDSEHMFSCPDQSSLSDMYSRQEDDLPLFGLPDLQDINNPFLSGDKLPIAAKKGMGY